MTVWETAEAARQQQHWRWWLEEDTQSIPYTDTSHSYLISKRARRQESSSYSIRRRRGLYDKLFWCTMEKRIVEELMTSQKDSQSSSSDRIEKKKEIPIMKSWVGKILLWWCWILAHLTLYWIYRDFQTQWILGLCKNDFFFSPNRQFLDSKTFKKVRIFLVKWIMKGHHHLECLSDKNLSFFC